MTDAGAKDELDYQQLISSCADRVAAPVYGKPTVDQLPRLKAPEISVVCRANTDVMDYLLEDPGFDFPTFAADIQSGDFCHLGTRMALMLERSCRAAIAYHVMCELENREVADRQLETATDARRWAAL